MPTLVLLLAPPGLLAISGVAALVPTANRGHLRTRLPGLGAAAALAVLAVLFVTSSRVREAAAGGLGDGIALGLRLDPVSTFFAALVLVPLAFILSMRRGRRRESVVAALAGAAAILGLEAANLALAVLIWGTGATLLLLNTRPSASAGGAKLWAALQAAVIVLLLDVAAMQVATGTSDYVAVPSSALSVPVYLVLALYALWFSCALPTRGWLHGVEREAGPVTASLFAAIVVPLGFYLLVRTYELGDGRWPHPALNVAMGVAALVGMLAAAYRAQVAASVAAFVLECIPFTSSLVVLALSLGTGSGIAAAVVAAAALAVEIPLLPAVAYSRPPATWLALLLLAGLPPALVFGSRLLPLQAAFESGQAGGLTAIAAAIACLLLLASAARAVRLPSGTGTARRDPASTSVAISVLGIAAGGFTGALLSGVALPVAATVMNLSGQPASGGTFDVVTNSGAWPAFAVLFASAVVALVVGVSRRSPTPGAPRRSGSLDPFFILPRSDRLARFRQRLAIRPASRPDQELRVPEALTTTPILFTALLVAVLVFFVTRWAA